jgi:HEAT repeat protein
MVDDNGFTMSLADLLSRKVERLSDDELSALRTDLDTMQQAGIDSFEQLCEAVGDRFRSPELRIIACHLLWRLREPAAAHAIVDAFAAPEETELTWTAAKTLASRDMRTDYTTATLIRVLQEGSAEKQSAAAYAMGWQGDLASIEPLHALAMNRDADPEARGHAIEALGMLQADDALPDLIALLADESPEVRYWACFALGCLDDPSSMPALERLAAQEDVVLSHGRSLKQEALDTLAILRGEPDRTD